MSENIASDYAFPELEFSELNDKLKNFPDIRDVVNVENLPTAIIPDDTNLKIYTENLVNYLKRPVEDVESNSSNTSFDSDYDLLNNVIPNEVTNYNTEFKDNIVEEISNQSKHFITDDNLEEENIFEEEALENNPELEQENTDKPLTLSEFKTELSSEKEFEIIPKNDFNTSEISYDPTIGSQVNFSKVTVTPDLNPDLNYEEKIKILVEENIRLKKQNVDKRSKNLDDFLLLFNMTSVDGTRDSEILFIMKYAKLYSMPLEMKDFNSCSDKTIHNIYKKIKEDSKLSQTRSIIKYIIEIAIGAFGFIIGKMGFERIGNIIKNINFSDWYPSIEEECNQLNQKLSGLINNVGPNNSILTIIGKIFFSLLNAIAVSYFRT